MSGVPCLEVEGTMRSALDNLSSIFTLLLLRNRLWDKHLSPIHVFTCCWAAEWAGIALGTQLPNVHKIHIDGCKSEHKAGSHSKYPRAGQTWLQQVTTVLNVHGLTVKAFSNQVISLKIWTKNGSGAGDRLTSNSAVFSPFFSIGKNKTPFWHH